MCKESIYLNDVKPVRFQKIGEKPEDQLTFVHISRAKDKYTTRCHILDIVEWEKQFSPFDRISELESPMEFLRWDYKALCKFGVTNNVI